MDLNEKIAARRRELQAQGRAQADAPTVNTRRSASNRMASTPGPSEEALKADPKDDPAEMARIQAEVQARLTQMQSGQSTVLPTPNLPAERPPVTPAVAYAVMFAGLVVSFYSGFIGLCLIGVGGYLWRKTAGTVKSDQSELEGMVQRTFNAGGESKPAKK